MAKPYKNLRESITGDPERVARIAAHRQAIEDVLALSQIRAQRKLTQADIARVLETSQANVSRVERQDDLYLSTLRHYVEALGGTLKVSAIFDDGEVEIGVGVTAGTR